MAYHINSKGQVVRCRAKKRPCPLGGNFETKNDAQKFLEENPVNNDDNKSTDNNNHELLKRKEELTKEYEQSKGIKRIRLSKEIERVNYALEGRDYDKEKELERQEREKKIKENELKQLESIKNSEILANKETIKLPKSIEQYVNSKPFSRANVKAYRGEQVAGAQTNSGLAMYGQGRYTTTDRSYAKKYGTVREAELDEMPVVPLRLKSIDSFQLLEQAVARENGVEYRDLYRHMDVSDMITKMGYDGLTMGSGKDMMIVKYFK